MSLSNAGLSATYAYGGELPQRGGNFIKDANKWLKKTGIIAKTLNTIGDASGVKGLQTASKVAKMSGYGFANLKKKH